MADYKQELVAQLETIEVPEALVASKQLVGLLKHYAKSANPQSPQEGRQIQAQIDALHLSSHLEVLANVASIDRQLRRIDETLKTLRNE